MGLTISKGPDPATGARAVPGTPNPPTRPALPSLAPASVTPLPMRYGYSNLVDALIKAMIALLQRVSGASVSVEGAVIGSIERGLLVLVAVHRDDTARDVQRLADRILTYRVFPDAAGRMNRSVEDEAGGLLLVPQFTLAADTRKGTRASFTKAAPPDKGRAAFDELVLACRHALARVETGQFGADMQVSLVNDGPVTFWLES